MRNMVSIREISDISPIENADRIEVATVSGWKVVVSKGKHTVGEKVAYFEIDSFLPENDELFAEFAQRSVRNVTSPKGDKVRGHVLRTMKLRKQISQGLIMSLDEVGLSPDASQEDVDAWSDSHGVFKYEPPVVFSGGNVSGQFPTAYARKTDSERVQNLSDEFLASLDPQKWCATEKIDGTSATFFVDEDGVFRVASRNYEVSCDGDSPCALAAQKFGLADKMKPFQVIQAEIYGEGIQKNPLKINGFDIAVFYTKNIDENDDVYDIVHKKKVPVLDFSLPSTVEEAVEQVNGMKSSVNPKVLAEGVVWWNKDGEEFRKLGNRPNFKAINNKFLLKHD